MSVAFVQAKGTTASSSTTIAATYTSSVSAGNFKTCWVAWNNTTATTTVSDSVDGSWTAVGGSLATNSSTGWRCEWFYKENSGSGAATVTATISSSVNSILGILEYSGVATSTPLDASNGGSGTSTPASLNVTTTADHDLLLGGLLCNFVGSPGSGFVERLSGTIADNEVEDKVDGGTSGTVAITATDSVPNWAFAVAAFKQAGGGGGGTTVFKLASQGVG